MSKRRPSRFEYATIVGLPAAIAVVLLAQLLEGAPTRALWQPTAALVVFGGTLAAILVSYPAALVRRALVAIKDTFVSREEPVDAVLAAIIQHHRCPDAKALSRWRPRSIGRSILPENCSRGVDGTNAKLRQILEVESDARREYAEAPADVLETAAGYTPRLAFWCRWDSCT
jgi:chemotaxis protein MotA